MRNPVWPSSHVTPAGTSNELDVQNGWKENTHNTYIYTVACILNSRLVSGHLKVVAGALWGFIFPFCYGSVGVQLTILRVLCQGTLTSQWVRQEIWTQLLSYKLLVQYSNPREYFFCFILMFKGVFSSELAVREQKKKNGIQQKTRLEAYSLKIIPYCSQTRSTV